MKIRSLITRLEEIEKQHGDIDVECYDFLAVMDDHAHSEIVDVGIETVEVAFDPTAINPYTVLISG